MAAAFRGRVSQSFLKKQQLLLLTPSRTPYLSLSGHICAICSISFQFSHRTLRTEQPSLPALSVPRASAGPPRVVCPTSSIAFRSPPARSSSTTTATTTTTTTTNNTATSSGKKDTPATSSTMASSDPDQDYAAFLNKANEDPSKGVATSKGNKKEFRVRQDGVEVPAALVKVCKGAFYVSDADEPFEAVALGWDEAGRGLPDEEEFAGLIQHWDPKNAEVEILDPVDWDSNGQYSEVVDAVTEAGMGNDVRVYKVARDPVRAEYFVVTTEGKGKEAKLVGVKALAVES